MARKYPYRKRVSSFFNISTLYALTMSRHTFTYNFNHMHSTSSMSTLSYHERKNNKCQSYTSRWRFFLCVFLFNFLVFSNVFYFVFGVKLKIEKDKTQQETNGKTCAYCRRSAARLILAPASPPTLTTRCCVCVRRGPLFFSLSLSPKLHGDKLCSSALWRIHTYPPSTDQSCFVFLLNSLSPSSLPIFRDRYSQFDGHTIKSLSAFFYLAICCLIKFICVFFFLKKKKKRKHRATYWYKVWRVSGIPSTHIVKSKETFSISSWRLETNATKMCSAFPRLVIASPSKRKWLPFELSLLFLVCAHFCVCVLVRVSLLRPCVSRQLFRLGNLQTNHKKKPMSHVLH